MTDNRNPEPVYLGGEQYKPLMIFDVGSPGRGPSIWEGPDGPRWFNGPVPTLQVLGFPPPSQVFMPVTARGEEILDNGGDVIARCFTAELAAKMADLLNSDARV